MPFKTPVYQHGGLDVYQEPVIGHTYVIVCDVARGVGLDYSAFSLFDVTKQPYRQVAKYRKNDISPMLYPNVIFTTAQKYNEAFVLVEVNDIGQQVADILYHDMEYENMMMVTMHGRNGQQIGGGFSKNVSMGIRTTKQVKRIGCATLKDLIERNNLIIEDFDTISELTTFIGKSTSFEADDGAHDDLVMCCVLFSWLVQQRYFRELTNQDIREKMFSEQMRMIEEEMVPFGFIEDGHDPDEHSIPGDDNVWDASWSRVAKRIVLDIVFFFYFFKSKVVIFSHLLVVILMPKSISFSSSGLTLRRRYRNLTLLFSTILLLT